MTLLRTIIDEFIGLFIDDGALALASAILIALVGLAARLTGAPPLVLGLILLAGCALILIESVGRAARRKLGSTPDKLTKSS